MSSCSATKMWASTWDYEVSWYLKRPTTAPEGGHLMARSVEEARTELATALSHVDVLATGWAQVVDLAERAIDRYLGDALSIITQLTVTPAIGSVRVASILPPECVELEAVIARADELALIP